MTYLLSWQGDVDECPASGGQWFFRTGNFVTLPELFYYLGDDFQATEIYYFYLSHKPLFTRKFKQTSHSAQGTERVNSRLLSFTEKGKKGQGKEAKGKEVKGKEVKGTNKKGKDKGKKGKGKGKGK